MLPGEIRIAIIEDEEIWSRSLAATLQSFGYTVSGIAGSFEDAVKMLNKRDYDLVLMDICINGCNDGVELGKMMKTLYKKPFIFLTASKESAVVSAAIMTSPVAYLTKPIDDTALFATIQSAINMHCGRAADPAGTAEPVTDFFFVRKGNKLKKIRWNEVAYLRSDKNYTILFNAEDRTEYHIRSTLARTLDTLVPPALRAGFCQVNRGEALQYTYIIELCADEVRTEFGTFTLTEGYVQALRKVIPLLS